MTLSNGASGPSGGLPGTTPTTAAAGAYHGIQMPTGLLDFSAAAKMQILLQTNNDLILAIHKAFVENTQDTNRKIESLRDDIRDIKLNLLKNDATLKDEAGQWRSHTELLLKEQGERHLQDSSRLSDMLMKLVIGGGGMGLTLTAAPFCSAMPPRLQPLVPMQPQAQAPPQPQWLPPPVQSPPPNSIVTAVSYALPITTMTTTTTTSVGTSVVFPPISTSVMPIKSSLVPFLGQKTPPSLSSVTTLSTPFQPELPMPASTLSAVAMPLTTSTTIVSSPFSKANIFAPSTQSSGIAGNGGGGGNDESAKEDEEEYTPDAQFEPVIELPPEVEVVSGEENEETIFVSRCQLYRYDRELKENKLYGLGDIKILKNPITQKYRCVMLREKVLTLCANFPILGDLKVHQHEHMPTAYTWACKDFSVFSARFKDVSIATEFNEKIKEAVQATKQQQD